MSEKRKDDWIKIVTPENKNMIASPNYIKKLLRFDLSTIYNRIIQLEKKVNTLESPQRQEKIINLLRDKGKHNKMWLDHRIEYHWKDLHDLVEKGIICETKSGTQIMYELSEHNEKIKNE